MDRTKTEQEFLDYCIKKGKGKLPIAIDLLELITDFIEVDRQKQLLIHSVSNTLTYDELKLIIKESCDIEDVRKKIDHRLG